MFNVLSYRASPQRSPSACGCWVCTPGGFHRLVYKPPGPRPRSAPPGTGCTEKHTQRFMQTTYELKLKFKYPPVLCEVLQTLKSQFKHTCIHVLTAFYFLYDYSNSTDVPFLELQELKLLM